MGETIRYDIVDSIYSQGWGSTSCFLQSGTVFAPFSLWCVLLGHQWTWVALVDQLWLRWDVKITPMSASRTNSRAGPISFLTWMKAKEFHHEDCYICKVELWHTKCSLSIPPLEHMVDHYTCLKVQLSCTSCRASHDIWYTRNTLFVSGSYSLFPVQECDLHLDDGAHGRYILPRESTELTGGLPPEVRVDVGAAEGVPTSCSSDDDRHRTAKRMGESTTW